MPRRLAVISLIAWGAGLCLWIWGRTGDILGDFGQELYVAWQLSSGKIFGRDLAYTCGPLSPWINALWMRLFGPSLNVIVVANLLVLIAVTVLLYRLLLAASSEIAAFVATAVFLAIFALSSGTRVTNYNFLTPYAHGMTHGLLLCLAMVECLRRFYSRGRVFWAGIAAFLTGAAFLTKPEMFLACLATFVLGFAVAVWVRREFSDAAMAVVMVVPPIIAWLILADAKAGNAVLGGWQSVSQSYVTNSPFYRSGLGIDDLSHSLGMIAFSAVMDAVVVGLLIAASMLTPKKNWIAIVLAAAACVVVVAAGQIFPFYWIDADRALILFAGAALLMAAWRMRQDSERRFAQWCLAALSLSLLAKIALNVRTYHYGFVLAAPCAMLATIWLVDWLPRAIGQAGASVISARWIAVGLLGGLVVNRLVLTNQILGERTLTIPLAFGGEIHARPIDQPAADAVQWLRSRGAPTAAVLPDAAGINFAAGLANPTPYDVLNPLTLAMWGEENAFRAFEKNPPDMILVINTNTSDLGAAWFGKDYGQRLSAWISAKYRPVTVFGDDGEPRSIRAWVKDSVEK
jgi:4-amino-4-deoxy-L-arabinose transferase-like glycosyltransferase